MALINCPECDKQISDKAQSCPRCGMPINDKDPEEYLACPKCKSKELHSEKSGFSGGKAFAGAVLTGGIGILAGTIGSKNIYLTCLKCNHRFKSGKAIIIKPLKIANNPELDEKIIERYRQNKNFLETLKLYASEANCSTADAVKPVAEILKSKGLGPDSNRAGCARMVLVFVLIGSIIFMII